MRVVSGEEFRKVQDVELTWADKLIKQGEERGIEQGREQGIERGREQGLKQGREAGLLEGKREASAASSGREVRRPPRTDSEQCTGYRIR